MDGKSGSIFFFNSAGHWKNIFLSIDDSHSAFFMELGLALGNSAFLSMPVTCLEVLEQKYSVITTAANGAP